MRIFLTGASGYIGSVVAEALQKAGHAVIGMARSEKQAHAFEGLGYTAQRGDLRDHASLAAGVRSTDAVIHTAMERSADSGEVDRAAVEAMLDAVDGSNRPFIYTSGCWVLGNTGDRIADEDTPLAPLNLVAWRPAVEQMVLEASARGVRSVVLRPAMVYGRGGGLVTMFTDSAREQGAARMVGDGANRWTFVDVDDLADLYVKLLAAPAGTLLYAADGAAVRVRDVAEAASRAAGAGGKVQSVPLVEACETIGAYSDGLVLDQQISGDRAKRMTGWQPHAASVIEMLSADHA